MLEFFLMGILYIWGVRIVNVERIKIFSETRRSMFKEIEGYFGNLFVRGKTSIFTTRFRVSEERVSASVQCFP